MEDHRCRRRQTVPLPEQVCMEAGPEPMTRYISPCPPSSCAVRKCEDTCCARESRMLLEQLVELTNSQNQLLVDLLGGVNALTAALLTARAQM